MAKRPRTNSLFGLSERKRRAEMVGEEEQSDELLRAVVAQDDFDFAYRLQLQEAMAASCSNQRNLPQVSHIQEEPGVLSHSPDDRALALALQNEELYKSQLEERDRSLIANNIEQLQIEIKRRTHDAAFAKSLMNMDDHQWQARGDLEQRPFNALSTSPSAGTSSDSALFCKLYITVASSENNTRFAMGAVIFDTQNIVLTTLKKLFPPGTTKAIADYLALLAGLQTIDAMGFQNIEAHTDSILLYNQVTNRWRVRTRKMQALSSQVREFVHNLPAFHMFLEPRNLNQHAMRLAREAVSGISADGSESEVDNKRPCSICFESRTQAEMVKIWGCSHEFCNVCIVQHAEVKVQAGQVPVGCPHVGCTTVLSLNQCQSLLSQRWYDLLSKRLIEASIPEAERVYCPYSDCSALMDRRDLNVTGIASAASSSMASTQKMCVQCARFFCMECRVPWHVLMSCDYYQSLPPEARDRQDAELHQLAKSQKWQRCKKCRRMIELSDGCYHMTCRCGYEFCYLCGKEWKGKAATCNCQLWDEDHLLQQPAPVVNIVANHELLVDDVETDSYDGIDFDEVDGRSNFLFVSNPLNPYYKTRLCRHWTSGLCFAGPQCNFAHGAHELR